MKDREQRTTKGLLAGPGVFCPDALAYGAALQASCARRGLRGLYPLDNSVTPGTPEAMAAEIFRGNVAMIDEAQAIVADISPFRGPNMDPGTAWEIGYGAAWGLPIFAWSSNTSTLLKRTQRHYGINSATDPDGMTIDTETTQAGVVERFEKVFLRQSAGTQTLQQRVSAVGDIRVVVNILRQMRVGFATFHRRKDILRVRVVDKMVTDLNGRGSVATADTGRAHNANSRAGSGLQFAQQIFRAEHGAGE